MDMFEHFITLVVGAVTPLIAFVLANFREVMLVVIALLLCFFAVVAFQICLQLFSALGQMFGSIQVIQRDTTEIKALLAEQNDLLRPKLEVITTKRGREY